MQRIKETKNNPQLPSSDFLQFGNFGDEVPVFDLKYIDMCMACQAPLACDSATDTDAALEGDEFKSGDFDDNMTISKCGACGKILCNRCAGNGYILNIQSHDITKICFYCNEKSSRLVRSESERHNIWQLLPPELKLDIQSLYICNRTGYKDDEVLYAI